MRLVNACHAGVSCAGKSIARVPVQQQAHVHILPVKLGIVVPKDLGAWHEEHR